ncbi:MAG: M20/M25/M40 family metallo-hydrolase [Chloroflexota bacterium]
MSTDFSTLIGLVEHYSPSGEERPAVEWLIERMKALGFGKAFVDEAGNAVGVMGDGPKQVVLLGHIDTVPGEVKATLTPDPSPAGGGEILCGRGSVDAKGPLACFVDAAAQVGAVDGWQFVVIGAVEEERDSDGARFAAGQYHPDFAIIGEPNNWDRIALGYKGSAWATITVRRGQAHTASGEQTAAEAAVELWLAVKAYAEAFNADKSRAFDRLLPTLRGMDSGQDGFEQWARLNVGCRLPVEVTPDGWYEALGEIARDSHLTPLRPVSGTLREGDCHVEIARMGYPVPAWECEKNSLLVRAFLNGIRQAGGAPRFVYKTGTADLNVVAPVWRCPAVVYGPGDSSLDHTPGEHISLEGYGKAVDTLVGTLKALASA